MLYESEFRFFLNLSTYYIFSLPLFLCFSCLINFLDLTFIYIYICVCVYISIYTHTIPFIETRILFFLNRSKKNRRKMTSFRAIHSHTSQSLQFPSRIAVSHTKSICHRCYVRTNDERRTASKRLKASNR